MQSRSLGILRVRDGDRARAHAAGRCGAGRREGGGDSGGGLGRALGLHDAIDRRTQDAAVAPASCGSGCVWRRRRRHGRPWSPKAKQRMVRAERHLGCWLGTLLLEAATRHGEAASRQRGRFAARERGRVYAAMAVVALRAKLTQLRCSRVRTNFRGRDAGASMSGIGAGVARRSAQRRRRCSGGGLLPTSPPSRSGSWPAGPPHARRTLVRTLARSARSLLDSHSLDAPPPPPPLD